MISSKKRDKSHAAVLFLDMDNFKKLNDDFGHQAGDGFLKEVATRLRACVRDVDTVARLGGDEFVIVVDGLSEAHQAARNAAERVARNVLAVLNRAFVLAVSNSAGEARVVEHRSTASVGVTLFCQNEESKDSVLRRADQAMYLAKNAGKNDVKFL